jgi:two-component system, sensor histidine kinase and response regulator
MAASQDKILGDILIVDDTLDNLRLLSAMLAEQGYEVRSVTNGATALMGIRAQPPDVILLDINMPGMNGYEVCRRLKAAFAVGGVDYIAKPFQVEEVIVRIENQLKLRRLQAQLQSQNHRLQQAETELRQALEQEQALNQRIEAMAALEERNRIARDIHDSLGHALVALNVQMETTLALWQDSPAKAYEFLVEAKQLGSEALKAVRQSVSEMRADPLQGELLTGAIETLLQEFQRTTGIQPDCQLDLSQPLSLQINTAIYRIVQEGLTNICKHAQATAVQLQIQADGSSLRLRLQDNGKGFRLSENKSGFGLQGMRERTEALSGQLEIISEPGVGCKVMAVFPVSG